MTNLYDVTECTYCGSENWRADARRSCVGCGAPLKWRRNDERHPFAIFAYGKPIDITSGCGYALLTSASGWGVFEQ